MGYRGGTTNPVRHHQRGKEEQLESSQYNTEPLLITATGKQLNKWERQQLYIEKEEQIRKTIEEEAKERSEQ
jgi:hypothetical protein